MNKNKLLPPQLSFKRKTALVLFGVFFFFVLLEASLRLGGFILSSAQEYRNYQSIKQKGAYRILCLGESTTQREYPQFLEEYLNQRHIGVRFSVIDSGASGTNTAIISSKIESYLHEYHPDMVVAMMGINDRGKYLPVKMTVASKGALFIRSLKIYKLSRLLWLHILNKVKACRADTGKLDPVFQNCSLRIGLGLAYAETITTEESLKKAIEINPKNDAAYLRLGELYREQGKFIQGEESLKKAIEINPENDNAHIGLGWFYREQGRFIQAEASFQKAIKINPKNNGAYFELGWVYRGQRKFDQAESAFKKAIELNPVNSKAFIELGRVYQDQNKFDQAESAFKKAIELDPKQDYAYFELGQFYRNQRKFPQAEDVFKKVIAFNPQNDNAYFGLVGLYRDWGKFPQAEDTFRKAIESNPKDDDLYYEFGKFCQKQRKFPQAEELLKKAIELNPKNDRAYRAILVLYRKAGKWKQLEEYTRKADRLSLEYYHPLTADSYRSLKNVLDKHKVRLVCVQYPMRSVEPLKRIFAQESGVVFVDNEKIFKEALQKSGYKEYFRDMFAGDFGHCTEKGNRLLARNIANVILREVFNK
ncbi:MAG: tetratricopeptide repeat protein [Candidatus Omnitrophica bacterium]|nr:tetratricopeptide repeat protein [Candidatus Omnitrophota bacterium]